MSKRKRCTEEEQETNPTPTQKARPNRTSETLKPVQKVLFMNTQCELLDKGGSRSEPEFEVFGKTPGILVTNAAQLAKSPSHNTSTLTSSSKQKHPPDI